MKKFFSVALMVMATFAASAQTPEEVKAKYQEAGAKMTAKEYAAAITMFEEAITMAEAVGDSETATKSKEYLAQIYVRNGAGLAGAQKFEEAIPFLEKGVASGDATWAPRAKSTLAQVYNALGGNAWNAEDYAKSAEYFAKAYEINPNDMKAASQLAESYGKVKDYEKSFGLFRELIAKGGDGEASLKSRLAFYMLLNADELKDSEPGKTIELLAESVDLDSNPQAWALLTTTAFNSKDFDRLIEFGDRAAEAQTDEETKSYVYSQLGFAYQSKGNTAKAIEAYRKVTSGPNAANAKAQVTALQAQN
jgi:lipopolysaccharide biosynthesis regulator YciM